MKINLGANLYYDWYKEIECKYYELDVVLEKNCVNKYIFNYLSRYIINYITNYLINYIFKYIID